MLKAGLTNKSCLLIGLTALSMLLVFGTISFAEIILTTDGSKTVIESVAPLGTPLTYVSGGDGLIGVDGSWPTMPDTPANRAFAASNYDHTWLQYNPAIIWSSLAPLSAVFAIPAPDHGPIPQENLEFIICGSNNGITWEEGKIKSIYRDGFDTANTVVGHSDDYTSLWGFGSSYTLFMANAGDHLDPHYNSTGEGEIDALAATNAPPIPEPTTLALFGIGLASLVGYAKVRISHRKKDV